MPGWLWVVLAVIVIPVALVALVYSRYRRMCRIVRQEIGQLLRENHPDVAVVGERQGNLVVQLPGGAERVWEMESVYAAVGRTWVQSTPESRAQVYAREADQFVNPRPDPSQPVSLAVHGNWLRPQLVTTEAYKQSAPSGAPYTPVPGVDGLVTVYLLEVSDGLRYVSETDRDRLGIDTAELHRRALEPLRRNLPRQMVSDVLRTGNPSAIQFGDTFNATRLLLLPELLHDGEELLALIPHRDMLVLLPPALRQEPDKLDAACKALACGDHPPLFERPLRVTCHGFETV